VFSVVRQVAGKIAKVTKMNPHAGSSFDDFLKEDGIYEEVQARALKRVLAKQLHDGFQSDQPITNVQVLRECDLPLRVSTNSIPVETFLGQGKGGSKARLLTDRRGDRS
jgi:hypothetical protein